MSNDKSRPTLLEGPGEALSRLEAQVVNELPGLNMRVQRGEAQLNNLVTSLGSAVADLCDCGLEIPFDRDATRHAIQLIGFVTSSIEHHLQAAGEPPGSGLALLPGVEPLLCRLAAVAQHPPKDSAHTYWVMNDGPQPLTFSGDAQEVFFNRSVNAKNRLDLESCDALRAICSGSVNLETDAARDALLFAADNTSTTLHQFHTFWKKDASGQQPITEEFFMTTMRTYLPAYPVGGTSWAGVNAAHLQAPISMDFLIGTTDEDYRAYVSSNMRFLTGEDQRILAQDMKGPSILDLVLDALDATVKNPWSAALGGPRRVDQTKLIASLNAFKLLLDNAAKQTSAHWALIRRYLIEPSSKLNSEQIAGLAVKPDAGTGSRTHEQTAAIRDMRKKHPSMTRFKDALARLNSVSPPAESHKTNRTQHGRD